MTDLFERLDFELDKRGMYRADLSRATGINESNFRAWRRGAMPSAEALYKVSKALGVSVEYLLAGEDTTKAGYQTYEEQELLRLFKNLDQRDKEVVMTMIKTLQKKEV